MYEVNCVARNENIKWVHLRAIEILKSKNCFGNQCSSVTHNEHADNAIKSSESFR